MLGVAVPPQLPVETGDPLPAVLAFAAFVVFLAIIAWSGSRAGRRAARATSVGPQAGEETRKAA